MIKQKPLPFIFHFYKRYKNDSRRIKWKIINALGEYIVDEIILKIPSKTYDRKTVPRAVMKGRGTIRFEYFKQDTFKKSRAIIE